MNRIRSTHVALALALSTAAGCDGGGSEGLVARAADHELTTAEATRLLSSSQVQNEPQVVRFLAELWIDYTLLATAAAEDSTLRNLDIESLVEQQVEQELVAALRDAAVQPDTAFTDEELEELYFSQGPGIELRARHILMGWPEQATAEQRDSVRARMEEILERIRGGEDFAELARTYSQDPGSAAQGGDLGTFARGDMVRPFEEAAYALEPGETSDIVESPYGYHVIRLEERIRPDFDTLRVRYREQAKRRRVQVAESLFVAGVEEGSDIQVVDGAADVVREIARNPSVRLSGRAARRPVARHAGGEFTVGELRRFMTTRQPQFRAQLQASPDEIVEDNFLRGLVQRELLVDEARDRGIEIPRARRDSLADTFRGNLVAVARQMGLVDVQPRAGEDLDEAISRTVDQVLVAMVSGAANVVPLGAVSFQLRDRYRAEIFDGGVQRTVDRIADARGPGASPGLPAPGPTLPTAPPPTTPGAGGAGAAADTGATGR